MTPIFAIISVPTMIVLGAVGVVVFGKRLPEVARSLGKTFIEFKKGMTGLEDELGTVARPAVGPQTSFPPAEPVRPPQRIAASAPKFEESPQA